MCCSPSSSAILPTMKYAHAIVLNRTVSFARITKYFRSLFLLMYRFFAFRASPFWLQFCYFISLSLLGSLLMMTLKPSNPSFSPRYIDMLYMSASALTVSGLNSVEMENFSSAQIMVLTLLMLFGGEVFTSLLALLLRRAKYSSTPARVDINRVDPVVSIELESIDHPSNAIDHDIEFGTSSVNRKDLKYNSIRYLGFIVLAYHLLIHLSGTIFILLYVSLVSSARNVLKGKGIHRLLFSFSVTVSSFANGGLIPTNENMIIFKKNTGLLLIIIPQILAGNTLFPMCLRMSVWALRTVTRSEVFDDMMKSPKAVGFSHLKPTLQTALLSFTVIGFIVTQVTLYCAMDWNSPVLDGLNSFQKIVNALFMAVNSRHAGEGTLDLSITSPAVLVLFIIMMYLPGNFSYLPLKEDDTSSARDGRQEKTRRKLVDDVLLSQVSSIAIFVIAVCISERKKLSKDPLNFSVLNIILEIVSAYGNVGLSTGYSCSRLLKPDDSCQDKMISLSGKWSDKGKLILIVVLLYGRLKSFTVKSGRAWKPS